MGYLQAAANVFALRIVSLENLCRWTILGKETSPGNNEAVFQDYLLHRHHGDRRELVSGPLLLGRSLSLCQSVQVVEEIVREQLTGCSATTVSALVSG